MTVFVFNISLGFFSDATRRKRPDATKHTWIQLCTISVGGILGTLIFAHIFLSVYNRCKEKRKGTVL